MDVCFAVSAVSPGCDCHDDQLSSDQHQQVALAVAVQMVAELAVAHQLHGQLPSVFRDWRQKDRMVAHLHQDANVPECPKLNANCLSRGTVPPTSDTGILETVTMIHWRDQIVCRVCFLSQIR